MSTSYHPTKPESKEYPVLPEDVYQAVILDITDKERPNFNNKEQMDQVYQFIFGIEDSEYAGEKIYMKVTPSLFPGSSGLDPSNLYTIFGAVNNRPLDDEDLDGIDAEAVNSLIGRKLRITLKIKKNDDGTERNKIDSFLPVK